MRALAVNRGKQNHNLTAEDAEGAESTEEFEEFLYMEHVRVGIREFRENLATYLLESSMPVAITQNGGTIGYYIPARRTRSAEDRLALRKSAGQLAAMLADRGVSEEELLQDFERLRSERK